MIIKSSEITTRPTNTFQSNLSDVRRFFKEKRWGGRSSSPCRTISHREPFALDQRCKTCVFPSMVNIPEHSRYSSTNSSFLSFFSRLFHRFLASWTIPWPRSSTTSGTRCCLRSRNFLTAREHSTV